jgi:hypothetical protein
MRPWPGSTHSKRRPSNFSIERVCSPTNTSDAAEGRQRLALGRPREMIAREEILVAVEQRHVAARVAGHGDDAEFPVERDFRLAFDDALDAAPLRSVRRVHDALAAERAANFAWSAMSSECVRNIRRTPPKASMRLTS